MGDAKEGFDRLYGRRQRQATRSRIVTRLVTPFVASLLVLSLPMLTHAQESTPKPVDRLYSFSRLSLYSGTTFDLATTLHGFHRNRLEANPLITSVPGNRYVATSAVVAGSSLLADLTTNYLKAHGRPKLAIISNFCLGGVHTYAGVLNIRHR